VKRLISFFSLFGSMSTLLCCALPVTLVSLGLGASFASLTSSFPQIIWLTSHKDTIFVITAIMLATSYIMMKYSEKQACPIDIDQRYACSSSKEVSNKLFCLTIIIYFIGLMFSYLIPRLY
jgi:hypothetical protein